MACKQSGSSLAHPHHTHGASDLQTSVICQFPTYMQVRGMTLLSQDQLRTPSAA